MKKQLTPAEAIEELGGVRKLAKATGLPYKTLQSYKQEVRFPTGVPRFLLCILLSEENPVRRAEMIKNALEYEIK